MTEKYDTRNVKVLVVDDERDITFFLDEYLSELGYRVYTENQPEQAEKTFLAQQFDVVLLDVNMPRISGLKLLEQFHSVAPDVIIIMISALQDVELVVKCIQLGAYDYVTKPIITLNQVHLRIQRALAERNIKAENQALRSQLARQGEPHELRFHSPAMRQVMEMIRMVAPYDSTVLILGESGTGKEVVARTIHKFSLRADKPFVAVNCGGIPESLLESTLFGHEKGAFTGATGRKIGLFEESSTSTIFLDEITETSLSFQVKLLRVLENSSIMRVGGTQEIKLDLRVLTASNIDVTRLAKSGDFRQDLFYRLNVFQIPIPPLRERKEDIPAIVDYHLKRLCKRMKKNHVTVNEAVLERFQQYDWPGNVRELINAVENALIMTTGDCIELENLPANLGRPVSWDNTPAQNEVTDLQSARRRFEKNYLRQLLQQTNGNVTEAARLAGISRQHLHLKLKELNETP
ncbi:MAG: sigma-54 dependent transcriptional regulator [Candidatus Marinimicrobia bacterium]|nr:sigma-54 dependent transcriptional regulator [Candidatus Neomarinimicrobiota bacterium]